MRKFLENKFARYARAISDEYERKAMFRLYCAKVAVYAAFIFLAVVFLIEILVFTEESSPEVLDAFFAVYGVTMFLVLATGIASKVLPSPNGATGKYAISESTARISTITIRTPFLTSPFSKTKRSNGSEITRSDFKEYGGTEKNT